jgi:hypothetical protein
MKVFRYGLQINRLHITWFDLWTNKVGLWIEWDGERKTDISIFTKMLDRG